MGGYGSGQYHRRNEKNATSDMLSLEINKWRKKGKWEFVNGVTTWSINGKKTSAINFRIIAEQNEIILSWVSNGKHETQTIRIYGKPQPYGKYRYYFICGNCQTLRSKLYAGTFFYCRKCYNLTYQSCKDSHKGDALARRCGFTPARWKRLWDEDKETDLYMRSDLKTRRRLDKKKAKRDAKYSNNGSYYR
jgi:hypothetical protein